MVLFKNIPDDLDSFDGQVVMAVVGQDEKPLKGTNAWLDWRLFGTLSELLKRDIFKGDVGEKCLIPTYGKFSFERLILLGGGSLFGDQHLPSTELGTKRWEEMALLIHETAKSLKVQRIGLSLPRFDAPEEEKTMIRILETADLPTESSFFVARAPKRVVASVA